MCIHATNVAYVYSVANTLVYDAGQSLAVLRIGSMEPGALLNDAFKEYEVCHIYGVLKALQQILHPHNMVFISDMRAKSVPCGNFGVIQFDCWACRPWCCSCLVA